MLRFQLGLWPRLTNNNFLNVHLIWWWSLSHTKTLKIWSQDALFELYKFEIWGTRKNLRLSTSLGMMKIIKKIKWTGSCYLYIYWRHQATNKLYFVDFWLTPTHEKGQTIPVCWNLKFGKFPKICWITSIKIDLTYIFMYCWMYSKG